MTERQAQALAGADLCLQYLDLLEIRGGDVDSARDSLVDKMFSADDAQF